MAGGGGVLFGVHKTVDWWALEVFCSVVDDRGYENRAFYIHGVTVSR